MINDEEAISLFNRIRDMLRYSRMHWIVQQVDDSISLGKAIRKKADASKFVDDKITGQRRSRSQMQEFVTTEPFSNTERLCMIIDAIERTGFLQYFGSRTLQIIGTENISFVPEDDSEPSHKLSDCPLEFEPQSRLFFQEIRNEIGAPTK